jgi:hypothetical protein
MSSEEAEGTARDGLNLTDPMAMRAMAHPVRMALLELLEATPALTATQASEVLGESPANCAFHLRTLAKYGFVREAGGGKGRERPWALMHRSIRVNTLKQPDKQAQLAASRLTQAWQERTLERIRRAFSVDSWPADWGQAVQASDSTRYMTAAELVEVAAEFRAIVDRYASRLNDPASRPPGALPVSIAYYTFPKPELAALGAAGESHDSKSRDEPQEAEEH